MSGPLESWVSSGPQRAPPNEVVIGGGGGTTNNTSTNNTRHSMSGLPTTRSLCYHTRMTRTSTNRRNTRLTSEIVYSMRERYATGTVTQMQLARELQVSINTIRNALNGVTWQHVRQVISSEDEAHNIAESMRRLSAKLNDPAQVDDAVLLGSLSPPTLAPASASENSSDLASLVEGLRRRKAELASDDSDGSQIEETRTDDK